MSVCLHPITLKNHRIVPCGRCLACRNRLRSSWAFRMQQEYKNSDFAIFATLTYHDEFLPIKEYYYNDYNEVYKVPKNNQYYISYYGSLPHLVNNLPNNDRYKIWTPSEVLNVFPHIGYVQTLNKEEIKLFLDNLQHQIKNKYATHLRYYICGEYGKKNHRPHYHAILFFRNTNNDELFRFKINSIIEKLWYKGYVHLDHDVNDLNIMYCTKYMIKKQDVPQGADEGFSLKSKGLGLSFLEKPTIVSRLLRQIENEGSANVSFQSTGIKTPLPRYYRDKIYKWFGIKDTDEELKLQLHNLVKSFKNDHKEYIESYSNFLSNHQLTDNIDNKLLFLEQYYNETYLESQQRNNLHKFESDKQ